MSKIKLTVLAPVYNEEEVIGAFHARLSMVLDSLLNVDAKILYVVDRCSDNTINVLRAIVRSDLRTKVITLSSRFGHQMSLVAGIDKSLESDVVIMMDSDLQHPPELIPELMDKFRLGFEVVYTVRRSTEEINPFREFAGNIFYKFLARITNVSINANAADFRLISGRVARIISTDFRERNMFLRGLFTWIGFSQTSVDYDAHKRAGGYSKYSLSKMLQLAMSGILSFSTKPLQLGIVVGTAFSLLSFLLMVWAVIEYFIDKSIPDGWTTVVVLLLLFSGIQLTVLGIIGAYIGGIYEEVKGRPRYIIDEEIVYHEQTKS
ncbi:glycosyltransferase family 2 protein [Simplicispira piscis]